MKLNPSAAVTADIYADEDGRPYTDATWPLDCGVAIILCPDCGEIDESGEFFEVNTVYSNMGDLGDNDENGEHNGCNECKSHGYVMVGI
jgi:hypothetical protein